MQTNQMMLVDFGGHVLNIEHKTGMGSLTQLWAIGNSYRTAKGLPEKRLDNWLTRPETHEYIRVVEKYYGIESVDNSKLLDSSSLEFVEYNSILPPVKSPLIISKRGRYGGTWAQLFILLDAATYLDAQFKFEVYKVFVDGKLLIWRDRSGDAFKAMNIALDEALPEGVGVTRYINLANAVRLVCGVTDDWNKATHEQLELRTVVESKIVGLLQSGLVTSEDQLLTAITKFRFNGI